MNDKLYKVDQRLIFDSKRNFKLVTPCCNKSNKDGKFVNFKGLLEQYGFCHSCGKTTLPPSLYRNENGEEFTWNNINKMFEPVVTPLYNKKVIQSIDKSVIQFNDQCNTNTKNIKYIDKSLVLRFLNNKSENNLLKYLRKEYGDRKVNIVKKMYYIGTSKNGGTIFWNINKEGNVQKAKVSYYDKSGKRTNIFKVPYKNKNGYKSCLFGEHLIKSNNNFKKSIVLVESEKTALVGSILIPEYFWLSYGGINGLTDEKAKALIGQRIIIIPDISENAVRIINNKLFYLNELGIEARVWDMRNGKSDDQLKKEGWYNCDLEDVFRSFGK